MTDYLIIGQGIAGSVLAFTLMQRGYSVVVVDPEHERTCSRVAAGLVNPITGRHMTKTWLCDQLFATLHRFYPEMERVLGAPFFLPADMLVPFGNIAQQNDWMGKSAEPAYQPYIKEIAAFSQLSPYLSLPHGAMQVTQTGRVNTAAMLNAMRRYLRENHAFLSAEINYESIVFAPDSVEACGIRAKKIIFAEGQAAKNNPFLQFLQFRPVKGEILWIETELPTQNMINRGCWIVPAEGNTFKVGSNYDHHFQHAEATEAAKAEITEKLQALLHSPYRIVDQKAGIRPATYDRKPFLGVHPENDRILVFNGLGTKGTSLAPFFAAHFADFLSGQADLMPEVNIQRCLKRKGSGA